VQVIAVQPRAFAVGFENGIHELTKTPAVNLSDAPQNIADSPTTVAAPVSRCGRRVRSL
jgi:hypothetical protein